MKHRGKPRYRLKTNGKIYLWIWGGKHKWMEVGTLTCGNYYWTQEYFDISLDFSHQMQYNPRIITAMETFT